MDEYRDSNENEHKGEWLRTALDHKILIVAVALLVVAGIALGYGYREQMMVGHLTAQESMARVTISQMQGQLDSVTAKLNEVTAAQAAAQAAANEQAQKKAAAAQAAAKRGAPVDKRYKQLQAQLEDQQKQLKETQDLVAKNRTDLEGNLSSTRDELNGSIARTHEELVVLQKRGERNYFEFDLAKSKQFQRVGPLSLALRKADTKHKSYDLQLVVDDNQLNKRNVNLYEPIWIHAENEAQPVQIVVNRVEKNRVHGYISAPKYKPSEISAAGTASVTPVAAQAPDPSANPTSPKEPE